MKVGLHIACGRQIDTRGRRWRCRHRACCPRCVCRVRRISRLRSLCRVWRRCRVRGIRGQWRVSRVRRISWVERSGNRRLCPAGNSRSHCRCRLRQLHNRVIGPFTASAAGIDCSHRKPVTFPPAEIGNSEGVIDEIPVIEPFPALCAFPLPQLVLNCVMSRSPA